MSQVGVGVAVIGTTSDHGGVMITATGDNYMTQAGVVCRLGDLHSCPIPGHGVTPIVSNCTQYALVDGKPVAIQGSLAGCGAALNGNFAPSTVLS